MSELPPLPVLTKTERRKNCGACGADIRKNRESRSSGLCSTCRWSVEVRGRPLVPRSDCKCDCNRHPRGGWNCMDDGACGDPVNRHVPVCCFDGSDGGDPAFRDMFNEHERAFIAKVKAVQEQQRREREARWAQERDANEVLSRPRHIHIDWSKSASDLGNESGRD